MQFIKQWTFCVCITLIISVVFSFIAPKGGLGRFFRIIISLFIFLSFLYPFAQFKLGDITLFEKDENVSYSAQTDQTGARIIAANIKQFLEKNGVKSASVTCEVDIEENVINIESVQIAVGDEYDLDEVKKMILNNYGINARVIRIGD